MPKKVKTQIKINAKGGAANPAPPIGPALGQHGVNIMDFCRQYNEKTKDKKGQVIPAVITIYEDRSFTFITKLPPVSEYIKKYTKLEKGSEKPGQDMVGTLKQADLENIAKEKIEDLNTKDIEQAKKIISGTARSMGIKVE